MPSRDTMMQLLKKYFQQDLPAAARHLESLPEEKSAEILVALPIETAAAVFSLLAPVYGARVLVNIPGERLKDIIKNSDSHHATALFMNLSQEAKDAYISALPDKRKEEIRELLTFPEDSAGRLMRPDFLAFPSTMKAREAIQKLRLTAKTMAPFSYVYVVDGERRLLGVISMRDLVLAAGDTSLGGIMAPNVFSVDSFTDREVLSDEFLKRKMVSIPVVDAEKHLLGIVRSQMVLEEIKEEGAEDLQKMFGTSGDEKAFSSIPFVIKKRLPWLHINLATAFMAASVVALFEDLIAKITVLAVFLPVVAGQGGNAGGQTLAVVMRSLVMREIPKGKGKSLILKEVTVGAFNGLVIGVVTGLIAWGWQRNPYFGVVIGLGMLVNLAAAGLAGATIPLTMKRVGLDPAQSSNIILTTVTDVVGFFAFLGFALMFQKFLI